MRVKKSIISILLIVVILIGLIPISASEIQADSSVPAKGGAFYATNIRAIANLNAWFNIWKDGNKYPYRGNNTNEWNPWGEAQCLAYSRGLIRSITDDNYGDKVNLNKAFTKENFLKACKGVAAGTHLRFTDWHSISLLKVTDKEVWWTECNWDHYNTIEYSHATIDKFIATYSWKGRKMQYIEIPDAKKYSALSPTATKYTIKYDANGGTGSMSKTVVSYGVKHSLRNNSFKRAGYTFEGWNAYRARDGKWIYTNGYDWKWYTEGYEPSGWTKKIFGNGASLYAEWSFVNGDTITAKAVWKLPASSIVKRLWGENRHGTMKAILDEGFKTTGGTVVVATFNGYKDALSISGFAGLDKAATVLTTSNSLTSEAEASLRRLKPKKVYIVGGTVAISESVESSIAYVTGVTPIRIFGHTAPDTSAEVALAGKGRWNDGIAIIATSGGYKDALSVAPIAYAKKYPILLAANGKYLTDREIEVMKSIGIKQVIIVGGEAAVSDYVVSQIRNNGMSLKTRLYGKNGVETSAAIANWGLKNGMSANKAGIASSQNYPDALAGAALCGYNKSVLLLADDRALTNASFLSNYKWSIDRAYVFGGTSVVGAITWNALINCLS